MMRRAGVPESEIEKRNESEELTWCYPDNWLPLQVLLALGTQWRMAASGYVSGLHYEVLPGVLDMMGVRPAQRADVFWALGHMESEAKRFFNRNRN